jgi:hypothetical protein
MIPSNIIICNENENIDIFKDKEPYKYTKRISELILGKYFNYPFFKILILSENVVLKNDDIVEILYNMVLIDGFLIIPNKYYTKFSNLKNEIKKYKNYIMIKKKINIIFNHFYIKNTINCIIIGVQKASTTSALINLSKHPDISTYKEEIHFFDIFWSKGLDFFKKHFNYNKKIVMCKNPDLIYQSHVFPLIQSLNPFTKFILFLRNPIKRAYSSWQMVKNNGWTNLSFKQSIEEELNYRLNENKTFYTAVYHYLQRGLYYKQIKKFLKWFPKQNLLILIIDNEKSNEEKEYEKIYDFLNITKPTNITYTKERIGKYENEIENDLYNNLIKFYKKDKTKLEKFLKIKINWF